MSLLCSRFSLVTHFATLDAEYADFEVKKIVVLSNPTRVGNERIL
jgi:hypothetical protein